MAETRDHKKSDKDRLTTLLIERGVRPTRQRLALAATLFDGMHKHVTAEDVQALARRRRARVSLATIYNTLHQFTQVGLLREITVSGSSSYFDTNIGPHHHFFDEVTGSLCDIPAETIQTSGLPKLPTGREVARIDVTVRLRSKAA